MKKIKNLALATLIAISGCSSSKQPTKKIGLGGLYNEEIVLNYPSYLPKIRSNKEIIINNSYEKLIKIEASGIYKQTKNKADKFDLFYLNLDGGIRWKRNPKYNLSSGFSFPFQGVRMEWDNFGKTKKDLEVIASWDWVPLSIEYFPLDDLSVFASGKIRYHYLRTLRFSGGIRFYISQKKKDL